MDNNETFEFDETLRESAALSDKAKLSLYKKSLNSGISIDILEEVYYRGYLTWNESFQGSPESFGFDRVNSFIAGGFATQLDEDLNEDLKKACWKGYKAIGMKKKNGKMVPNCVPEEHKPIDIIKRVIKEILEDWQNKKYKSPSGGLTKAGVDAYRRENPGSKLQTAVTTKPSKLKPGSKASNRRKSFCARMGGMKRKLTSSKTANDPDSRINKALRKWNC